MKVPGQPNLWKLPYRPARKSPPASLIRGRILADTLNEAIGQFLERNKSPSRKVNELDNRGSHYYLAMYWAEAVAAQNDNPSLKDRFAALAKSLADNEDTILQELLDAQGAPVDIGGYYRPDPKLASAAMRPSATLNEILASI